MICSSKNIDDGWPARRLGNEIAAARTGTGDDTAGKVDRFERQCNRARNRESRKREENALNPHSARGMRGSRHQDRTNVVTEIAGTL
jgi:hypothetical protein